VEKYNTARHASDDNIIRRMRIACWITKATDTHSDYVILIAFSTATVVTRTRLNVTLYVHCLYCYFLSRYVRFMIHRHGSVCLLRWRNRRQQTRNVAQRFASIRPGTCAVYSICPDMTMLRPGFAGTMGHGLSSGSPCSSLINWNFLLHTCILCSTWFNGLKLADSKLDAANTYSPQRM
jgi:hypothetical protein